MGLFYTLLVTLLLSLVILNCSGAADVEGGSKTGRNVKDSGISNKDDSGKETVVIPEKKGKDQVGSGVKDGVDNKINKAGNSKGVDLKGAGGEPKKTDDTSSEQKKPDGTDSEQKKPEGTGSEQKKLEGTGSEQKKPDGMDSEQKKPDGKPEKPDGTGSEQKKPDGMGSEQKKPDGKPDGTGSEQKKKKDKGPEKDGGNKEKAGGDSDLQSKDGTLAQVRKEGGEACDSSSNSCTIEEKSVIACLRVAGSDSEELSLLIQNKGKGPVSVTISAPDFVKLEKMKIQVQDGKNEKVTVSIGKGESKSGIILKAGNGNCTIDFKEMSAQSSKKDTVSSQLAYINVLKSTPSLWFVLFAAVLVIASVCIGIRFRHKYVARNSPSYEKLEMELPVLGGSKTEPDSNDGWDDSWGDNWDDEEAPKTPSMPVTPSLSSHGISSRRVNKDARKD